MLSDINIQHASDMTVRDINKDCRSGRYIYYHHAHARKDRIFSARKRSGQMQVCRLNDGQWLDIN